MKITFNSNPAKLLEAIIWIVTQYPNSDFHFILKTLFYADKYHLQQYGRPVTGDIYVKMAYGPVASLAFDMLKKNPYLSKVLLSEIDKNLTICEKNAYYTVSTKRAPNLEFFSGTDLECLEKGLTVCKDTTFSSRSEMTHQEKAWVDAQMNCEMDYLLFIDQDIENRVELINYIKETHLNLAL